MKFKLFDPEQIYLMVGQSPTLIFQLQEIYNAVRKEFPTETLQLFTIPDLDQLGLTVYTMDYSIHAFPKFNRVMEKLGRYSNYPVFGQEPVSKRKINIYLSFLKNA